MTIHSVENITDTLQDLTPEQFIVEAHKLTAIPSLIILYIFTIFLFLIIGLIMAPNSRPKFWQIWFISVILSLVILLILIFLPNVMQRIISFF